MTVPLPNPGAWVRFVMDPSDWLAFQQQNAGTPDIFRVALNALNQTVVFRVGTSNVGRARRQVAGYNIHFVAASLASPSILFSLQGARSAFAVSDIVLSTGAPGPGGIVVAESANQWGKAGYYFAAPVNQAGGESILFAGPIQAPIPGTNATAATPPDVSDPDLVVTTETVLGQSVRKLMFSAVVPSNGLGVSAIFIGNAGSGLTESVPLVFTGGSGSGGASGTAVINDSGGVGEVIVTESGSYYTAPTVTAPPGSATLYAELGPSTSFAGYQIYIDGYAGGGLTESNVISGANATVPGSTLSGFIYLLPDTPPFGGDIDFYFVSLSPTGTRRINPTSSPSFTLVGGLT